MRPPGEPTGEGGGHRGWPVLSSLTGYRRAWLVADLLAGLTLVAIVVPEQLATSRLAGMPLVTGLYAFVAAALLFAALGSSRQLSVGADSTIAPLLAAGVTAAVASGSGQYAGDMALLAIMVGVVVIAVGVARMGWIADFLSFPVVTGFLAGVAVTIIASQLSDILGLPPASGNALAKIVTDLSRLGDTSLVTLAVAVVVFVTIVVCERLGPRVPGALIGVVVALIASYALDLAAHGVATIGALPSGLPPLSLPPLEAHLLWKLTPAALSVALIVITQTSATTRSFADLGGYEPDVGRDFVGVGAGSVLAGFMGAFAVNASPPRTALVAQSGGRTQVPGLAAAAIVVVLVLAAVGLLADLPLAALGAVLIFIALRIFRVHDLAAILRFDRIEFVVAIATLTTVVVLGVGPGILLAVLLAILDRTWRSARPRDDVLGRLPGTTVWWSIRERPDAETVPGVLCYRFDAALYFANATRFRDRVRELVAAAKEPLSLFVLDASGVDDIDYTGGQVFLRVVHELHVAGIDLAVARATGEVPRDVAHSGLRRHIGYDHLFITVDEAVRTLGPHADLPAEEREGAPE